MVGDNLDADVRGAQTAGLYAIWLTRRAGKRDSSELPVQPDASLSALWELPAFLDRLQVQ
jgi:FMN phosphatase YigB (HAD superfamily)